VIFKKPVSVVTAFLDEQLTSYCNTSCCSCCYCWGGHL